MKVSLFTKDSWIVYQPEMKRAEMKLNLRGEVSMECIQAANNTMDETETCKDDTQENYTSRYMKLNLLGKKCRRTHMKQSFQGKSSGKV